MPGVLRVVWSRALPGGSPFNRMGRPIGWRWCEWEGSRLDAPADAKYWVAFHHAKFVGPARMARLVERFGDLAVAWAAPASSLRAVLDERSVESVLKTRAEFDPDRAWEEMERAGIAAICLPDPRYPRLLREVPAPPPVLYVRGALLPEDETAVAIVGTRRSTAAGREMATNLGEGLAGTGVTVVSGLARGIDAVAHQAALAAGGRTIAVLGSGPDVIYPPEHRHLAEQIIEVGAVLSDYPPGRPPDAPNFPARNRIISGLSLGVVIVEAPERSGALITADFAADQGRDVFVVPGSPLAAASAGSNRLLRDGARPVLSADDVLADLRLAGRAEAATVQQALPLDDEERRVLSVLSAEPQHIDEVALLANLPVATVGGHLVVLELKGLAKNAGALFYARRR